MRRMAGMIGVEKRTESGIIKMKGKLHERRNGKGFVRGGSERPGI